MNLARNIISILISLLPLQAFAQQDEDLELEAFPESRLTFHQEVEKSAKVFEKEFHKALLRKQDNLDNTPEFDSLRKAELKQANPQAFSFAYSITEKEERKMNSLIGRVVENSLDDWIDATPRARAIKYDITHLISYRLEIKGPKVNGDGENFSELAEEKRKQKKLADESTKKEIITSIFGKKVEADVGAGLVRPEDRLVGLGAYARLKNPDIGFRIDEARLEIDTLPSTTLTCTKILSENWYARLKGELELDSYESGLSFVREFGESGKVRKTKLSFEAGHSTEKQAFLEAKFIYRF